MRMKEFPTRIKGIDQMLASLNLTSYKRHDYFHILKFTDHADEMAVKAYLKSEDYFEITLTQNHNTEIQVDQTQVKDGGSNLFFLSPGQEIRINAEEIKQDSKGYMVLFTAEFIPFVSGIYELIKDFPYFNMHLSPSYTMNKVQFNLFEAYMEQMYREFQHLTEDNLEIIRAYLIIFLYKAKNLVKDHNLSKSLGSKAEQITYHYINLLKNEMHKKQNLAYYAEQIKISVVYLSESVKKTTGQSAKRIMMDYMLSESKSLLQYSDQPIDVITQKIGFTETPNFIQFFKKETGQTPHQFRVKSNQ